MSDFEFGQDEQGFDQGAGWDHGGDWQDGGSQLDPWADPGEFDQAVRAMVDERLAPIEEHYQAFQREVAAADAEREIQDLVAGHSEPHGQPLDTAEVHALATDLLFQHAHHELVQRGVPSEAAIERSCATRAARSGR